MLQAVVNVYRTVVKGNLNRNWFRIKKVIGHTRFKGVKFLKHNAHRPKEKNCDIWLGTSASEMLSKTDLNQLKRESVQ